MVWICVASNWSRLCENGLHGLEEQPGGRWQNSICSHQTLTVLKQKLGTEEVSAYMAGHCVSGADMVPILCLQELELISQLQICFFSQGNKGSCYNDTIRERLWSVHVKCFPVPVCALVVFCEQLCSTFALYCFRNRWIKDFACPSLKGWVVNFNSLSLYTLYFRIEWNKILN